MVWKVSDEIGAQFSVVPSLTRDETFIVEREESAAAKPRLVSGAFGAHERLPPHCSGFGGSRLSYAVAGRFNLAAYPFRNFASFGATTAAQ